MHNDLINYLNSIKNYIELEHPNGIILYYQDKNSNIIFEPPIKMSSYIYSINNCFITDIN